MGAHTYKFNDKSIGITFIGNFNGKQFESYITTNIMRKFVSVYVTEPEIITRSRLSRVKPRGVAS